ncbi:hypothetical protein [Streptomyces sp. NPDC099088]
MSLISTLAPPEAAGSGPVPHLGAEASVTPAAVPTAAATLGRVREARTCR